MVKRGTTTFSATKVAKAGLVASAALQKIMDLEKEVSKLRHHVSVLLKRNHLLQKEAEKGKKEVEVVVSEVASPGRVEEPEPRLVAEPLGRMSGVIVAEGEEDVWVAPVAKQRVAESRVALEMDEPEVALVVLPKSKRRRLTVGDDGGESGDNSEVMTVVPVEVDREVMVAPVGLRGYGGRAMVSTGPRRRGESSPREAGYIRREYRFVDRSMIGERNGMVGDSYRTRGNYACAPVSGLRGGYVGRGYRPYR